jgi:poly-gamma-glutamate capsule biosynthesis protein CapA/YwtB (metallophosphatase superfamily)
MQHRVILTGDINLLGVSDPTIPFTRVAEELQAADVVFSNLECCFYEPDAERSVEDEGFYASLKVAEALKIAGVHAVGNANNVNYGAPAIRSSLDRLDSLGIPHTGAGVDREAALKPVVIERDGIRYGFLQRTSVYWNHGHEAKDNYPGVATIKAHTAYRPRMEELRMLTRPGMAPEVVTWADPDALDRFRDDIADLRRRADFVVASNHWGLDRDVLAYQTEIARAAIDSGADIVMGHGPHVPLAAGYHRGKPIFYGLGSFSFETGHRAMRHPDWIGLMVRLTVDGGKLTRTAFSFVRHNDRNETSPRAVSDEAEELTILTAASAAQGAVLTPEGNDVVVTEKS